MNGEGHWIPSANDIIWFCPAAYPDNPAKGNVHEAVPYPKDKLGGIDMFGIEWEYVPAIGGSTVRPGKPALDDVNNWKEAINFPDINSWRYFPALSTALPCTTTGADSSRRFLASTPFGRCL